MTPEELQQCLEDAFGDLEPPDWDMLGTFYPFEKFLDVVKTDTAKAKRWQDLRPLTQYLHGALDIYLLRPEAFQYYLPAYLYAMTDPEVVWQYLSPVVDKLWYEDEYGDPVNHNPDSRYHWEYLAALFTDRQRRCIAHFLAAILKSTMDPSVEVAMEVDVEGDRIEHMLNRYWNAWL
jgi:hypothetical protein